MSTQNHSAMNRLKPKTPSKSQLVMEKLKASIEAEKKSTKKEVKSKLLSSVGAPSKGEKRDDVVESKSAETPTSTSGRKEVKNSVSEIKHPRSLPRTVTSSTPSKSLSSFGRIGSRKVLGSKENQSSKENPATIISKNVAKTPTKTSTNANLLNKDLAIEQQKLIEKLQKQLKNEKMNADVFIIVSKTLNEKNIRAQEEVNKLENLLKQINSNHELALQKLDDKWKNDFQKADELHKNEIEDVRSLLQADSQTKLEQLQIECERIVNEYEEKMNALKSQLVEQQKQFQLNESQRNKRLTDEIASRSFELQLKNEELARLRSENRDLQFRVETISEKDVQITKLEKKNEDLREGIDRLKQIEKSLISQLETIRHQRDQAINKTKEIEKDKEILEYRLTDEFKSPRSSNSTPLNFHNSNRTPLITTTERPNSSCLSLGRSQPSFENDMAKSIDSALSLVKCYQQEGRSKSQNTPTKIYTPRECYECKCVNKKKQEVTDPPVEKHSPILSMKQQRIIERTVDFEVNEDSLN
uniref:Uncharacterized protein n=1 Tax=Meloidogyne hapla TaxID=6305 RepID=A0A1I8BRR4_MELHA